MNALPVLVAREQQCRAECGRIPNLVAVNWADVGALQQVVDDLNGE